jgi:hypothetical protein
MELEKAAKHGARHGVKIKKMWSSPDGYGVNLMLSDLQIIIISSIEKIPNNDSGCSNLEPPAVLA